jgi:hypothetical protein
MTSRPEIDVEHRGLCLGRQAEAVVQREGRTHDLRPELREVVREILGDEDFVLDDEDTPSAEPSIEFAG